MSFNEIKNALKNSTFWLYVVIVLEAITIAGLLFVSWDHISAQFSSKDSAAKFQFPPAPVEVAKIREGSFPVYINTVGTLKANESVSLRPEENGRIKEMKFKSGQHVNKGTVLVILENEEQKARLKEAEANLKMRKSAYDRTNTLFKKKVVSEKEFDEAYAHFKSAEAAVDLAKDRLNKTYIKAPFEGVVGLIEHSVGTYIRAGDEIVTIEDIDPIKVDFNLSEIYLDKVKPGQEVQIEVEGFPEYIFAGTIDAVSPSIDPQGHSVKVRALLNNKNRELKSGLFAKVRVRGDVLDDVIIVPETAVETRGSQEFLYVVVDNKAHFVRVTTGSRNGEEVEVKSSILRPGMMVVTSGQMRLTNGSDVKIVKTPPLGSY